MSNLNSKTQLSPKWQKTIVVWVLINAFALLIINGLFGSWISIGSPPSGVKRIVTADFSDLWVETYDSNYFVAKITYGEFAELSYWWEPVDDISEIPKQHLLESRGSDCTGLRFAPFVRNPIGQIVECIYAESPDEWTWRSCCTTVSADLPDIDLPCPS